jgi:hypothetical protein
LIENILCFILNQLNTKGNMVIINQTDQCCLNFCSNIVSENSFASAASRALEADRFWGNNVPFIFQIDYPDGSVSRGVGFGNPRECLSDLLSRDPNLLARRPSRREDIPVFEAPQSRPVINPRESRPAISEPILQDPDEIPTLERPDNQLPADSRTPADGPITELEPEVPTVEQAIQRVDFQLESGASVTGQDLENLQIAFTNLYNGSEIFRNAFNSARRGDDNGNGPPENYLVVIGDGGFSFDNGGPLTSEEKAGFSFSTLELPNGYANQLGLGQYDELISINKDQIDLVNNTNKDLNPILGYEYLLAHELGGHAAADKLDSELGTAMANTVQPFETQVMAELGYVLANGGDSTIYGVIPDFDISEDPSEIA